MEKYEITKLDSKGRGISYDSKPIFVFNALVGETVSIDVINEKSKYKEATVNEFYKKSEKRVKPLCPYFGICGGCDIMHMNYTDALDFKFNKVKNTLSNILKHDVKVNEILFDDNLNYRNKATFKVNGNIGYYAKNSHDIINIDKCYLVKEKINELLNDIKKLDLKNIYEVVIKVTNESLVIFKTNKTVNVESLKTLKADNIVLYDGEYKVLYGNGFIYETLGDYVYKISPDSFFQVNSNCAFKLYSEVLKYVSGNVLDLYCGTGSIGIFVSKKVNKVHGVEINKYAVYDALENKKINNLKNIDFECLDASNLNLSLKDYDTVIVDPPRSGLDKKTLSYLLKEKVNKLIYVSCDLMTLTRDLKELENIYSIKEVTPVDMFPNTYHCESVVILERK